MEEWKIIPGFSNYMASSHGRLKSLDYKRTGLSKILKPAISGGYLKTMLKSDNGKYISKNVHWFVTLTFFGERPIGYEVNHKNCDKLNNALSNLEYITHLQNMQHASSNGKIKDKHGSFNGMAKLTESDVDSIRLHAKNNGRYYGRKSLAEKYGVSEAHIKDIVTRRKNIWSHV